MLPLTMSRGIGIAMRCRYQYKVYCVIIIIIIYCLMVYFSGTIRTSRNYIPRSARCNVEDITVAAKSLVNTSDESTYLQMTRLRVLDELKQLSLSNLAESPAKMLFFTSSPSLDQNIAEQITALSKYRDYLSKDLSTKIRRRLDHLQNPKDCEKARKLYCDLKTPYGLACGIHDLLLCCIEAYRTNKMLIVMTSKWYYSPNGWEKFFRPLSHSCPEEIKKTEKTDWPGFPERKGVSNVLKLPHDIKEQVEQLGPNPMPWWSGQLLGHFVQPNSNFNSYIEENIRTMEFGSPIVGIHVRRTDKLIREAKYYPVEDYMEEVEKYFKRLEKQENKTIRRRVFLTTDDPAVVEEAENRYPEYEFKHTYKNAIVKGCPEGNISEAIVKTTLLDIFLLARTDFIVCTFSSGFCRLAYEFMLYRKPSALGNVVSLDKEFHHALIENSKRKVLFNHIALLSGEISLKKGDFVTELRNDTVEGFGSSQEYDGCVYGVNHETNRVGYYPLYKTKIDFGTLEETNLESLDVE